MSEAPSSIACASVVWTSLTAGRLAARLGDLLALGGTLEGGLVGFLVLIDLDLCAVELLDRLLEVGRIGDGELDVVAERKAQVVGAADVGRVGDGDEQQVARQESDRHGLVAEGELLLEECGRVAVGLGLGEVDVLEAELVGERLREIGAGDPAVPDCDLAEAPSGQALLLEGLLDLVHGQQAAVDQQRAEMLPGQLGRFHVGYIVVFGRNMKAVVQRVSRARVCVGEEVAGEIGFGLCVLLGVARGDDAAAASRLAEKVARLRIFENVDGRLDRSLLDVGGEALVVSQFTLIADTAKGNRPSFGEAAPPEEAEPLYERFCAALGASACRSRPASSARAWPSSSSTTAPSRSCSSRTSGRA